MTYKQAEFRSDVIIISFCKWNYVCLIKRLARWTNWRYYHYFFFGFADVWSGFIKSKILLRYNFGLYLIYFCINSPLKKVYMLFLLSIYVSRSYYQSLWFSLTRPNMFIAIVINKTRTYYAVFITFQSVHIN